ncbi:hypothetical protein B0H13DRAFT_2332091 [Mycena leptocephala]|nr:hypothetical protein B0H13DRAFT_2332091 [Mycena leptocephala]
MAIHIDDCTITSSSPELLKQYKVRIGALFKMTDLGLSLLVYSSHIHHHTKPLASPLTPRSPAAALALGARQEVGVPRSRPRGAPFTLLIPPSTTDTPGPFVDAPPRSPCVPDSMWQWRRCPFHSMNTSASLFGPVVFVSTITHSPIAVDTRLLPLCLLSDESTSSRYTGSYHRPYGGVDVGPRRVGRGAWEPPCLRGAFTAYMSDLLQAGELHPLPTPMLVGGHAPRVWVTTLAGHAAGDRNPGLSSGPVGVHSDEGGVARESHERFVSFVLLPAFFPFARLRRQDPRLRRQDQRAPAALQSMVSSLLPLNLPRRGPLRRCLQGTPFPANIPQIPTSSSMQRLPQLL